MDNEKDEMAKKDKEKMTQAFNQKTEGKKKPVAKDLVKLKHVEIKKQEVDQEAVELAKTIKTQIATHDSFDQLSNDEKTILETFEGKRLFLTRIAIIINQSRVLLGIEPFKKADLEKILGDLIAKGYVLSEIVGDNRVYYLSERGKERAL